MTSQRQEILRHLAKGRSLTPLEAFLKFNCLTLSQRCTELRKQGWKVVSELVNVGGKRVARYSIPGARR